jgi:HTH-type transcriptional regulator / antitoxin HigA
LRCIDGAGGSTAYRTASILRNNRAVSNVKGNTYRLVVAVKYEFQIVYIRFVGTHAAYDNIKAEEDDMTIKPIKTERDYQKALKEIEKLWDAKPNTAKGDRLDVLVTLVEAYEQKHYRIDPPDPIESIKFRMEQLELKPSDLADILGGRSRVSEILNKKRKLTVEMMRSLRKRLAIPAESLLA